MNAVHFAAPDNIHYLWLVFAVVLIVALLERRGLESLGSLVSPVMQHLLVRRSSPRRRIARLALLTASGTFLTLALMRPQVGLRFIETPRIGAEIMICLDVSNSMLAEDVTPNRLERAKAEIRELLSYLGGDQVGLIAFAGRATVLSPMTPDFGFLRLVLDEAGPASVSRGGTRLEEPIRKAIAGFGEAGDVSRSILLITDGEDHDSFPLQAANEAGELGIRILSIGFGDEDGAEITTTDRRTGARSALRDADGNIVMSRLDGELLREMALATDGAYIPAGTGLLDLESIYERHIARLTRGRLDGHGRAVRDDTFQLAILLGLACLIAAVAVGSRVGTSLRRRGDPTRALGILVPMLLTSAILTAPPDARAQQAPTAPSAAVPNAAVPNAALLAQPVAEQVAAGGQSDSDADSIDARASYNIALNALSADSLDAAEGAFETARARAGTDLETRYRATYNLGWVEVKRADAKLAEDPQASLEALQRSASWFQRAVDLRPSAEEPRYNLELVTRRAIELADQLRAEEDSDLLEAVTAVLERQREFIGGLTQLVDAAASANSPAAQEAMRSAFRSTSALQLVILGEADELAQRAADELAAIQAKSEEERTPEEAVRGARLGGFLNYVHRTRERMGQARARMRQLEAERSYRRAAASLDELKRARDQLLDPVDILDQLIADGVELARQTGFRTAVASGLVEEQPEPPAWLTQDYLADSQITLTERTDDLYVGIEAGLQQMAATQQEVPPEQAQFVRQITEAAPHIAAAVEHFRDAAQRLHEDSGRKALEAQGQALAELTAARESFLDLRRLIDLLYETEARISLLLTNNDDDGLAGVLEYSAAGLELQAKNLERATRIETLIDETSSGIAQAIEQAQAGAQNPDGSAPDPQALEQEKQRFALADQLADIAVASMNSARAMMEALGEADIAIAEAAIPATRNAVDDAVNKIADLRSLFFNLIEHLKETARRQVELGDETEVVEALADDDNRDETAVALGPLEPRQRNLATVSAQLAAALSDQSAQLATADPAAAGQGQAQDPAETAAKMAEASNYVAAAGADMNNAAGDLLINPAPLATVRADQRSAVDNLLAAIALLEPPPPPQDQEGDDQQQEQKPEQPEQQDGEGQQPEPQEQPQRNTDPSQLLQGVRDREAQRRAEQAPQNQLQYDPVEKDW